MGTGNTKSTYKINAMYEELRYKQLKENVMHDVKKELDLSFEQSFCIELQNCIFLSESRS